MSVRPDDHDVDPGGDGARPGLRQGGPPDPDALWRVPARLALSAWLRVDASGTEHVPDDGVIIAATHQSHADSVALALAVRRSLTFLGDERLADTPVLGPLLPRTGMVGVRRGEGDAALLDDLAGLLRRGHAVVLYPEGSRSRDGHVHRPRSGVARLAAGTRTHVVPAGVAGTERAWPVGAPPRPLGARVQVRFGAPLAPPSDDPASRRRWSSRLQEALCELSGRPPAAGFSAIRGGEG